MLLTFDTSGKDLHLGLFGDDAVAIAEFHHIASASERGVHDSLLAEQTNQLLREHSLSAKDISRIGFITGPGSFTGLRIGLAFAKGLAYGCGAELVPIIFHHIIKECALRSYPALSFDGIITEGYEASSVYYAPFPVPTQVTLRPVTEILDAVSIHTLCGNPSLQERFAVSGISYKAVPLELSVLAELTRASAPAESIASLEPFYGADFKVKPATV